MKRYGRLWPELTSFSNLLFAAKKAARRKRSKANVLRFRFDIERELCRLQDALLTKTYEPGRYNTFEIFEPKPRLINAASTASAAMPEALLRLPESAGSRTGRVRRSVVQITVPCRAAASGSAKLATALQGLVGAAERPCGTLFNLSAEGDAHERLPPQSRFHLFK